MNFTYTLYPGNDRPPLKLYAVQGEAGSRTITIHLPGASVGGSAYAYVVKNDGHVVVIDCETTSSSVTFTLPLQACTAAGWQKVYLQILSDGSELRYDNISLFVEPCNIEGAVASTDDLGPLADIIINPEYLEEIQNAYITAKNSLDELLDQFSPKGEYDPNTAYKALNIVSQDGSSYVALQPTTGNAPPNPVYWQLLAEKGEQGEQGEKGATGEKGNTGDPGQAATIQVGSVITGEAGSQASVVNSGTENAAVLNFTIPRGDTGPQGIQGEQGQPGKGLEIAGGPYENPESVPDPEDGACYLVGSAAPYDVYYRNNGKWDNLGPIQGAQGPQGEQGIPGQAATVQVGQVTTGQPGSQAAVTNSGTESAAVLNFTIPQGAQGQQGPIGNTPQLTMGEVTTLEPGQQATASFTGTAEAPVLHLGIPQGQTGPAGQSGISQADVIALVYPVGSIYTSVNNVNPGSFLPGTTWEPFASGKMLVGVDATQSEFEHVEQEGGEIVKNMQHTHPTGDHVLTLDEMASHTHGIYLNTQSNTHSHTMSHSHGPGNLTVNSSGSHEHGIIYRSGQAITMDPGSSGYRLDWTANGGNGNNTNIQTTTDGSHTHSLVGTTSTYSGETGDDTHSHRISGTTDPMVGSGGGAAHNHGDTGVGGSMNFSVLNPYITVYFWKRTA